MKRCTKCGIEKDENEFHRDITHTDGLRPYCKQCEAEYNRSRHGKHTQTVNN